MKKTGICPKCGSKNIVIYENPSSTGTTASEHARWNPMIKVGFLKMAFSTRYICCDCGYSELYYNEDSLEKIKSQTEN